MANLSPFDVQARPNRLMAQALSSLLFVVCIGLYMQTSISRHRENPEDRVVPNQHQLLAGIKSAVLEPAGLENSIGTISAFFFKDPTDPRWKDDAYTKEFLVWLQEYYPRGKPNDIFVAIGYNFAQPLVYLLTQCGDDLSRENIMRQATSLHDVALPWLLPRITLNTNPTDHQPIKQFFEGRFNGRTWELLDDQN